jgi:hypothetical protein
MKCMMRASFFLPPFFLLFLFLQSLHILFCHDPSSCVLHVHTQRNCYWVWSKEWYEPW